MTVRYRNNAQCRFELRCHRLCEICACCLAPIGNMEDALRALAKQCFDSRNVVFTVRRRTPQIIDSLNLVASELREYFSKKFIIARGTPAKYPRSAGDDVLLRK